MARDLGDFVESVQKQTFLTDALLQKSREIEWPELTAEGQDRDKIMKKLRSHYFRRIKWPTNPHHRYRIDANSRKFGIGRRTIDTHIRQGIIHEEHIDGHVIITEHDMVRALLRPTRKEGYTVDVCRAFAVSFYALPVLINSGILKIPDLVDVKSFFDLIFPVYQSSEWKDLAKLPEYPPVAAVEITDLTADNPLVTSGPLRAPGASMPYLEHEHPNTSKMPEAKEPEPPKGIKNAAIELKTKLDEPKPNIKNTPKSEPNLRSLLEILVIRKPAFIRKSEFPFNSGNFSFIPDNGQHDDASYVRCIDFNLLGKQWDDPRIRGDDAYRLHIAMAYLSEMSLRAQFRQKKVSYDQKKVRDALAIACVSPLIYKGEDKFPLGTFQIVAMDPDDLDRVGELVRPVIRKIGPFVTFKEITTLLDRPLDQKDFKGKVGTQIPAIQAIHPYAELFGLFQVIRAYEQDFVSVLTRI